MRTFKQYVTEMDATGATPGQSPAAASFGQPPSGQPQQLGLQQALQVYQTSGLQELIKSSGLLQKVQQKPEMLPGLMQLIQKDLTVTPLGQATQMSPTNMQLGPNPSLEIYKTTGLQALIKSSGLIQQMQQNPQLASGISALILKDLSVKPPGQPAPTAQATQNNSGQNAIT
jgi:hypothetical protein